MSIFGALFFRFFTPKRIYCFHPFSFPCPSLHAHQHTPAHIKLTISSLNVSTQIFDRKYENMKTSHSHVRWQNKNKLRWRLADWHGNWCGNDSANTLWSGGWNCLLNRCALMWKMLFCTIAFNYTCFLDVHRYSIGWCWQNSAWEYMDE